MKNNRRVSLRKIITNINLSEADDLLKKHYKHIHGKPRRPTILSIGIFLSFILMYLKIESYRDYHAFLEKDSFWIRTLSFKQIQDISSFTHFLQRIGTDTFKQQFQVVVQQLLDKGFLNLYTIAQD